MIISNELTEQIKILVEEGRSLKDIASLTRVPTTEISALKRKNKWQVSAAAVASASAAPDLPEEEDQEANRILAEVENDIAVGGRNHANRVFARTSAKLSSLKKLPALKTWRDIEIADRIARRAAGLSDKEDGGGGGGKVLINLGVIAGSFKPSGETEPQQVTVIETNPHTPKK